MKKVLFIFFSFIFLIAGEIKTVIVTGYGINEEKAMQNATKNALQQVVGMYVVSDEIVKNDKLIKDEVLSSSNGFVKSFKVLKVSQDDGMYQVDAKVEVELGKVIKRLEDLNIATKKIDTAEFKAVTLSKISNTKDFKKIAKKVIFNPIIENKKIYSIRILSFDPLDEDSNLFKEYSGYISEKIEKGLYPFLLTIDFGINKDYYDSVIQLVNKTSKKCSTSKVFKKNSINFISKYVDGSMIREKVKKSCEFSIFRFAMLKNIYKKYEYQLSGDWIFSILDKEGEILSQNKLHDFMLDSNKNFVVSLTGIVDGKIINRLHDILVLRPMVCSSSCEFPYKKTYKLGILMFIKDDLVDKVSSVKIERVKSE